MSSAKRGKDNPLGMQLLSPEGPYIPPQQLCSQRRREYFARANSILGSYTAIAAYSDIGKQWVEQQANNGTFNDDTPMRLTLHERVMQTNYRVIKRMFQKAMPQLTNYIYLMIYGNLEAFLSDLVCDGLTEQGHASPVEETIRLMMAVKWRGKIDRISQALGFDLGKRKREQKFQNLGMEFIGDVYKDPIEYLEKMADVRHRLVHYNGRVDAVFAADYPNSGLSEGDLIFLPPRLPYDVHFYFILLTEIIDEAFSQRFGWPRELISPEQLMENP